MYVLFEGYPYKAEKLPSCLRRDAFTNVDGEVVFEYVGYYYDPELDDCIFFLPKVLIEEIDECSGGEKRKVDRVFGVIDPENIVDLRSAIKKGVISAEQKKFICDFSVWIYRAIWIYRKNHPTSNVIRYKTSSVVGHGGAKVCDSFLDVIMELLRFNTENKDFFLFTVKNLHSGQARINWGKTVVQRQPLFLKGSPVYGDVVRRGKPINFDEELLVVFYSILNYIRQTYGFACDFCVGYQLVEGESFERYKNGYGKQRLRRIKYRYFSDRLRRMWDLCFAFFDHSSSVLGRIKRREYLLASDFHVVFEAIVDELIGDKRDTLPKGLKDQPDGKRVDHLYKDRSLTSADERDIYYVGDSKYYKLNNPITKESIYKQFTYARNLIQWNVDVFNNGSAAEKALHRPWRDEITEGYDVIPNFFISARLSLDREKNVPIRQGWKISRSEKHTSQFDSFHFTDRLFDRDTLLITHYDVNFLYVISLYARANLQEKVAWKSEVRALFRSAIRKKLQEIYDFRVMTPLANVANANNGVKEFLGRDFHLVLGKVYRPYSDDKDGHQFYSLAMRKDTADVEKQKVLSFLSQGFMISPVIDAGHLDIKPDAALNGYAYDVTGADMEVSSLLPIQMQPDGYAKAIRDSGYKIAWALPNGMSPQKVKLVLLGSSQHVSVYRVKDGTAVSGPLSEVELKQRYPAYAEINLQPGEYYVWEVGKVC